MRACVRPCVLQLKPQVWRNEMLFEAIKMNEAKKVRILLKAKADVNAEQKFQDFHDHKYEASSIKFSLGNCVLYALCVCVCVYVCVCPSNTR